MLFQRVEAHCLQQLLCSQRESSSEISRQVQGEQKLDRLRESELVHGRWAMLGVVGALLPELLGFGDWFEAPLWAVNGGTPSYFGVPVPLDIKTLILVEIVAMAGVELLRAQESEPLKRAYPGALFGYNIPWHHDAGGLQRESAVRVLPYIASQAVPCARTCWRVLACGALACKLDGTCTCCARDGCAGGGA